MFVRSPRNQSICGYGNNVLFLQYYGLITRGLVYFQVCDWNYNGSNQNAHPYYRENVIEYNIPQWYLKIAFIEKMPHERYGAAGHRQLQCLFNSFVRQTSKMWWHHHEFPTQKPKRISYLIFATCYCKSKKNNDVFLHRVSNDEKSDEP